MSDQQRQRKATRQDRGGGAGKAAKRRSASNSSSSSSRSRSGSSDRGGKKSGLVNGKSKGQHRSGNKTDENRIERKKEGKEKSGKNHNNRSSSSSDSDNNANKSTAQNNNNKRPDHRNLTTESSKQKGRGENSNINNHNNNLNNSNNNNNNITNINNNHHTKRPVTSHARLESTYSPRGYDNRNQDRVNLGSSTDQVADQRPIFGAWRQPDPERQRQLVERLAPARPPAPPDPRFNHWKNHFLYYWQIGVDEKPRRQGNYQGSPRVGYHSEVGRTSARSHDNDNHRLLKRPKTTTGRLMLDNSNSSGSSSDNNNNMNQNPYTGSASVGGRHTRQQRGFLSAREYSSSDNHGLVSGLDRRYMGLQAVSSAQMEDIVHRLTRMTSAYHAKFAPNPHVWVDNEPGAHMVKRSHTTVG